MLRTENCVPMLLRTLFVLSLQLVVVRSHLSAVCTATHEQRPQSVTFLLGTYHKSPAAGAAVQGAINVRSPEGRTLSFPLESFCAIPHDDSPQQLPVPLWSIDANVSDYRERLQHHCVCSTILGCGFYDQSTNRCSSTKGDCATLDPHRMVIECFGQNFDVPTSTGMAWGRRLQSEEPANCAYGAVTGESFPSWMRTWYTAQVNDVNTGNFEVWMNGTDHNLGPSNLYFREHGQHPCTMSEDLHTFLPITVADGARSVRFCPTCFASPTRLEFPKC